MQNDSLLTTDAAQEYAELMSRACSLHDAKEVALALVAVVSTIFSFVFMRHALALSGWRATYFWFSGIACAAGAAWLVATIMSPYAS